jgi:catecholate siderophore receptor
MKAKSPASLRPAFTTREALALGTLLAAAPALAADAPAQTDKKSDPKPEGETQALTDLVVEAARENLYKPEKLQSVKYTEPLRDVPQTITVVPQEVIKEQNASTLRDVLRNVPGISIQAGEGGVPNGDNMSIRGFNARTDLFVDGVRDTGGYTRDPFNLAQVEVAKGPASANNGRGSTGGSVNLASKTPAREAFTDLSLGGGSDYYGRATVDYNQPLDNVLPGMGLRLNTMAHHNDTPGRDEVEQTRYGLAGSLAFGQGTDTRVTLSAFHQSEDNQPDYGIPWVPTTVTGANATAQQFLKAYGDKPSPVPFDTYYGLNDRDYEHINTDSLTAAIEHDIQEGLKISSIFRAGRTHRDSMITAPRYAVDSTLSDINPAIGDDGVDTSPLTGNLAINRQLQARDNTDSILQNQTNLLINGKTGSIEHDAVIGMEASLQDYDNTLRTTPANASQANVFHPNPDEPFIGKITWNGDQHSNAETFALYAFDTLKFDKHWQLSGGLRYDYFHTQYTTRDATGATTFDDDRRDNLFNWRAALTYKPVEEGSIYLGFGTSSNPSAEALSLGNTATSTNNVNLDPEKSETLELGTKWDLLNKKLAVSAALFRTTKTNARTEDPASSGDFVVLDGEQVVQGLELGASGQINDRWRVFGGYTFMDSEIEKSRNPLEVGRDVTNTPEHSFSLWTVYDLTDKLDAGLGGQFVDSRCASTTNNRVAPSYWTLDAMASYDISKNWQVRVNVYNLLDQDYIGSVGGGHFVPGTTRSVVFSTNYRF